MGTGEAYTGFWWGNLRERDHLGDPGVDGRRILRWILRKWDVGHGLDRNGHKYTVAAHYFQYPTSPHTYISTSTPPPLVGDFI